ncbi:MAG: prepilin-type N-terminal cleavage/methylation domain-containing protein [Deltaproteobacteria bacterium]|nr:prepilin-type N-terminal cleavage/methylation domain-containing protein [Deltaproteobacteria bacterium]
MTTKRRGRGRGRGFTLLEAAVTLAIMAIVTAAAIGVFAALSRVAKQAERDALLLETLRTGLLYLVSEGRQVGGVGVQPWASAIIEDNCSARAGFPDCNGSDRLTLVQAIPTYPGCLVIEDLGAGTVRFETVADDDPAEPAACCFFEAGFSRQVALVLPDAMEPALLTSTGADCLFRVSPIVPPGDLARPLGSSASFGAGGLRNAVAVLADVKTFYVEWTNPSEGTLKMHVELNGDEALTNERLNILEHVADFQAAIGYDVVGRPFLESADGVGDSWWPGLAEESGNAFAGDAALAPERAVFLGVSLIAVTPTPNDARTFVQTPWGPPRVLQGLRPSVGSDRVGLAAE